MTRNYALIVAGVLSCVAAFLHISVIVGGPDWYRFFGAGEEMAVMAEQGSIVPTIATLTITCILFVWGLYAFSGARLIKRLPFLRFCLLAITAVYLLRGFGGLVIAFFPNSYQVQELGLPFVVWSSLICSAYGVIHLLGVKAGWRYISGV